MIVDFKNFENFAIEEAKSAKFFVDAELKNSPGMWFAFFEVDCFEVSLEQKCFLLFIFFPQFSRNQISDDIFVLSNFVKIGHQKFTKSDSGALFAIRSASSNSFS